jgi:hypothetical protein
VHAVKASLSRLQLNVLFGLLDMNAKGADVSLVGDDGPDMIVVSGAGLFKNVQGNPAATSWALL